MRTTNSSSPRSSNPCCLLLLVLVQAAVVLVASDTAAAFLVATRRPTASSSGQYLCQRRRQRRQRLPAWGDVDDDGPRLVRVADGSSSKSSLLLLGRDFGLNDGALSARLRDRDSGSADDFTGSNNKNDGEENAMTDAASASLLSRRDWCAATLLLVSMLAVSSAHTNPAFALVKGVAPPPKTGKQAPSSKPRCTNVDECQALAEIKEREEREQAELAQKEFPTSVTPGGIRYRDIREGKEDGRTVRPGDEVELYYKVLKLGKRSYDGLSGEGTVVFSRGYGLEDDEKEAGTNVFATTVGAVRNIAALNEVLSTDMKVGGIRRFSVVPEKGWRKPTRACDGGPGGTGAGGDVRTDYIVVPTAQLVAEESCFDTSKQPFPATYAQQRRMAQRFDQSLIVEVEVVSAGRPQT